VTIDTSIEQKILRPKWWVNSMVQGNSGSRMTNVLCSDGKRRTVEFIGEPDTFFTQPGRVKVNHKTVTGFIWFDSLSSTDQWREDGVWKFTAYSYRKNGYLLPEWESV